MFRRSKTPVSAPAEAYAATADGAPWFQQMAVASTAPVVPAIPQFNPAALQSGWAPFAGTPNPSQQIGMYAGGMLNQFPAILPGAQLHSGREWGNSRYYTPYANPNQVGNGGLTQTTRPNNVAGAQRFGSAFQGPIGPLSAQANAADVVAAQIRQSGLSALGWARNLTPSYASQGGSS